MTLRIPVPKAVPVVVLLVLAASAVLWVGASGLSDAAWTGIGVMFGGLCAAAGTIAQAKFSMDKAVKIALLEADNKSLRDEVAEKDKSIVEKDQRIAFLEGRPSADPNQ